MIEFLCHGITTSIGVYVIENFDNLKLPEDKAKDTSPKERRMRRTKFKLASLIYKALHTGHPPYLAELLQYHKPARSTHSSASHSLSVPHHSLSFGSRAFRIWAPKIWNSLPPHIQQSQTLSSFRRHLKTHYFQSAYAAP